MFGSGGWGRRGGGGGGGGGRFGFGPPPWMQHMHGMQAAILRGLNLTDEQVEKVAELKLEGLTQFAQFKISLAPLIRQMVNELTGEKIDRAKVKEIAQQMRDQRTQFGDALLERVLTFAEILSPEQRKNLRATAIRKFLGLDAANMMADSK